MSLVETLKRAYFFKIQCDLRLNEPMMIEASTIFRLRRGMRAAAHYALPPNKTAVAQQNRFSRLMELTPACDPLARKQHQKIGPAFAIQYHQNHFGHFHHGDIFTLEIVVWGGDVAVMHDLILVLQALGKTGLRYDRGRFDVVAVRGENSSGFWQPVWQAGQPVDGMQVPLRDAGWWLDSYASESATICLNINSPARLMVKGKPLFKADFNQLFPFIVRRVMSVLYGHCHLDVQIDVGELFEIARQVQVVNNNLRWFDWRELEGGGRVQPLGGVVGSLEITGSNLVDLLPYIYLGSLMNLGKNAAYAAGCYSVQGRCGGKVQ